MHVKQHMEDVFRMKNIHNTFFVLFFAKHEFKGNAKEQRITLTLIQYLLKTPSISRQNRETISLPREHMYYCATFSFEVV